MKILDLFCGAGGAAVGYHRAFPDAHIVGVDQDPKALSQYPFDSILGNAYDPPVNLDDFDLIHASPPCQAFSTAQANQDRSHYPTTIQPLRDLLAGRTYVIENVPRAPMRKDLMLCGSMVGLQVQRHRIFEMSGIPLIMGMTCQHEWELGYPIDVSGKPCGRNATPTKRRRAHWKDINQGQQALGVPWIRLERQIAEAIPPAYTQYIGEQIKKEVSHEETSICCACDNDTGDTVSCSGYGPSADSGRADVPTHEGDWHSRTLRDTGQQPTDSSE